ncbi:hypothetical protein [Polyangium sp. 15x6]|uniref:hypothetical protein n=1 Tax=Polyangium sp. 15x6 TaxID=3042687 RepID=UPI00249A2270|nr:hypothetical protein [Polyangium sp. 15x6]MDI3284234.1 hypothetical protein [Polyangium sp. 15x6]
MSTEGYAGVLVDGAALDGEARDASLARGIDDVGRRDAQAWDTTGVEHFEGVLCQPEASDAHEIDLITKDRLFGRLFEQHEVFGALRARAMDEVCAGRRGGTIEDEATADGQRHGGRAFEGERNGEARTHVGEMNAFVGVRGELDADRCLVGGPNPVRGRAEETTVVLGRNVGREQSPEGLEARASIGGLGDECRRGGGRGGAWRCGGRVLGAPGNGGGDGRDRGHGTKEEAREGDGEDGVAHRVLRGGQMRLRSGAARRVTEEVYLGKEDSENRVQSLALA